MSTRELRIDEEFAALIPPLTDDEYSRLEQSIIAEGCRDPIITWNGIIVDGHHRFKICKMHNIDFQIAQKEFASRKEVFLWMIQNQLARRNLNDFQRIEIVRKYENAVKALAKLRQGTRNDLFSPNVNQGDNIQVKLPECETEQSRDKLGKLAGVSGSTYEHASKVIDNAPTAIVNATRNNEISINTAYQTTKLPEPQQAEIAERSEKGENAKSVISEVKSRNRKPTTETPVNTADDVPSQSAASETSPSNEDVNVQHDANTTTLNDANQSQEVSSTLPASTELPPVPQQEQPENTNNVFHEQKERHIPQQSQAHPENNDITPSSDNKTLQPPIVVGSSKDTAATIRNEEQIAPEAQTVDIRTTEKKYSIIYADPTWEGQQSAEELCKLPMERIAAGDCALLLWAKGRHIPEALNVKKHGASLSELWRLCGSREVKITKGKQSLITIRQVNGHMRTANFVC